FHSSGQLRKRFLVGRRLEEPEERADAPYRFEPRLDRAAVASMAVVKATREGTASARTVGVDRACALGPQRRQRCTRLLERGPPREHAEVVPTCAPKLLGREGDAPEQGPVATEPTRPAEGLELGFGSAAHLGSVHSRRVTDTLKRCAWAGDDPLYIAYH